MQHETFYLLNLFQSAIENDASHYSVYKLNYFLNEGSFGQFLYISRSFEMRTEQDIHIKKCPLIEIKLGTNCTVATTFKLTHWPVLTVEAKYE